MGFLIQIIFICFLLIGCGPRRADPAEQAVKGFVSALYRNDMTTALNYVTEKTRANLKAHLGGQGTLRNQLETRLDWRYERPVQGRPRVVEGHTNPSQRIVEYEMGGQTRRFPVSREGVGWKVALADVTVVEPAPKAAEGALK